jgi:hypothetical protein
MVSISTRRLFVLRRYLALSENQVRLCGVCRTLVMAKKIRHGVLAVVFTIIQFYFHFFTLPASLSRA